MIKQLTRTSCAEQIAISLGGRRAGQGWVARCPAHDDRNPSLSIRDAGGKPLVHCHAGCAQHDVIDALRAQGLWDGKGPDYHSPQPRRNRCLARPDPQNRSRSAYAESVWREGAPARHSLVETYLSSRGLELPRSSAIRFHEGLKHSSGEIWPCMVALITRGSENSAVGIHRTFLARDGAGKAPVIPAKMMLGPCRGGAVRLTEADGPLVVAEGIETALSLSCGILRMPATIWAALSTSGLRGLDLPKDPQQLVIAADGDDAGRSAAQLLAERASALGWDVSLLHAPDGRDWNDVLATKRVAE